MIMYRHTSLRVPCVSCGVEQALTRMELSPRGGHWCWRCQMSAQIAEHEAAPLRHRSSSTPPSTVRQLRGTFMAAIAIVGGVGLLALVLLTLLAAYGCRG